MESMSCRDVARLFLEFYLFPRAAEVYNLGGRWPVEQFVDLAGKWSTTFQ
jgi:hypothetical protein